MASAAGSSPRTWGTRGRQDGRVDQGRFIPTHMGNARSCRRRPAGRSVHPHAHGERRASMATSTCMTGSSPRTWGTPFRRHPKPSQHRFIPTHMGNASRHGGIPMLKSVHPHAHGERLPHWRRICGLDGSSPRTWGTLVSAGSAHWRCSVHPHAHGERHPRHTAAVQPSGSSPRTWGTRADIPPGVRSQRFIPTHMGNASDGARRPA